MKSGGPWNLRGLRPEAREAVRTAARRSGVSVGEWLNDVIEPDDEDDDDEPTLFSDYDDEDDDERPRRSRSRRDERGNCKVTQELYRHGMILHCVKRV